MRRLPCGSSRDRVPAGEDKKKTFTDVGDLLTMSFSAGLSKYSGSIHSIHTIQSQEQHNNIPYKRPTRWLAHFLPNDL